MMNERALFQAALALAEPWSVERVEFPPDAGELHLYLNFARGAQFACAGCGQPCGVHDTDPDRVWRHLNFWQHPTFLHARLPRTRCAQCGVRTVAVPWARPGSGFTLLFEVTAVLLTRQMPVAAAARVVGEHETRLWRLVAQYVETAEAAADWSSVRYLGLDETFCRRGAGAGEYLTLAADLESGRVLTTAPGRERPAVAAIGVAFAAHGGQVGAVEAVTLDLDRGYACGARETFPGSTLVLDRFHVVQLVHQALENVRRAEAKQHPELKGSRYLWLQDPDTLNAKQKARLEQLLALPLQTVHAYHWKRQFQQLWEQPNAEAARRHFRACLNQAGPDTPAPLVKLMENLDRHRPGILAYFQYPLTNGLLEGLSSLIQAAKARARGFRTDRYFHWIIMLVGGKLFPQAAA